MASKASRESCSMCTMARAFWYPVCVRTRLVAARCILPWTHSARTTPATRAQAISGYADLWHPGTASRPEPSSSGERVKLP